ncbi:MAG: hypothetical protein WC313_10795 [Candidatus Kapaibacterium sp.]|jgi:hypothetical protein|nr:hypothetical protein [Candidatus Kapabacteria bacterium]
MKQIISLFLLATAGLYLLSSCSEEKSTTPSDRNLFPETNGSYWIYNSTYVEDGEDKTETDSTVAVGKETIKSQSATKFAVYVEGQEVETYYRYSNDSKLYALPSELLSQDIVAIIPSDLLPDEWVVVADDKADNWEMFQFNVENIPLEFSGVSAVLNGQLKVTGIKGGSTSLTIDGSTVNAQEFTTKINYTGQINYSGMNIDLPFEIITKHYFADGIGLVKTETPKQEISVNLMGTQKITLYTVEASTRILHHYQISN